MTLGVIFLTYVIFLGVLVFFDANLRDTIASGLVSLVGGGATGAVLTIATNRIARKVSSARKQGALIVALERELEQVRSLCRYNEQLMYSPATFVRLPTMILANVTGQPEDFPLLSDLQERLHSLLLAESQVNQLIGFYEIMWGTTDVAGSGSVVAARTTIQQRIRAVCSGQEKVEGIDNTITDVVKRLQEGLASAKDEQRRA